MYTYQIAPSDRGAISYNVLVFFASWLLCVTHLNADKLVTDSMASNSKDPRGAYLITQSFSRGTISIR